MRQVQQVRHLDATISITEPTSSHRSLVTPVLMMAGSLIPSKQLPAQQPTPPTAPTTATALVEEEREATSRGEPGAWPRKAASACLSKLTAEFL